MVNSQKASTTNVSSTLIYYEDEGCLPLTSLHSFHALDIRIGTVTEASINSKARVPSLKIVLNFGEEFKDLKQSSAQLRDNYLAQGEAYDESTCERLRTPLLYQQVAAVTNFPKRNVGIPSFFLTLGVASLAKENGGTVVVTPVVSVKNGARVTLLNDEVPSENASRLTEEADYETTFKLLDVRVGTVISLQEKKIDFGEIGMFTFSGNYPLLEYGTQILRVINLAGMHERDNFLGVITADGDRVLLTLERPMPNGRFLR